MNQNCIRRTVTGTDRDEDKNEIRKLYIGRICTVLKNDVARTSVSSSKLTSWAELSHENDDRSHDVSVYWSNVTPGTLPKH